MSERLNALVPSSPQEVRERFRKAAAVVWGAAKADRIGEMVDGLERLDRAGRLAAELAGPEGFRGRVAARRALPVESAVSRASRRRAPRPRPRRTTRDPMMRMPTSRTIADLVDEMAARYPDKEAIVYGNERLTYAQMRGEVRRLAKGLYKLGVRRGDKVALLMGNQTEWLLVDFAVTLLGGHAGVDQHLVQDPRAGARSEDQRGRLSDHGRSLPAPGLHADAGRDRHQYRSPAAAATGHLPERAAVCRRAPVRRSVGRRRFGRRRRDRRGTAQRVEGRHRLHPVHVRNDVDAEGRAAGALRPDREHVEHRRTHAPHRERSAVDGRVALLGPGLRERAVSR